MFNDSDALLYTLFDIIPVFIELSANLQNSSRTKLINITII